MQLTRKYRLQFIFLLPDSLPPLFLAQMSEMKRLVFEDLQVWISVDGKELEQYGVHLDEGEARSHLLDPI